MSILGFWVDLGQAPRGELQRLHGLAVLYHLPGTSKPPTSCSALLGFYPGILSPATYLLVNQLLVVWQHRRFVQLFPPRKALRQQGRLLPVGLG